MASWDMGMKDMLRSSRAEADSAAEKPSMVEAASTVAAVDAVVAKPASRLAVSS